MKAKLYLKRSLTLFPLVLSIGFTACSSGEKTPENEVVSTSGSAAASPNDNQPALAVSTVASLISVSDVMVRDPARFKKALCSDNNIYDLEFDGSRFSTRAEPTSVCVLLADAKNLKPSGFCGDARCDSTPVTDCSEADQKELLTTFAKEQALQRCWNVGNFPPITFTVLTTRVGQSCQAQTLVKTPQGWRQLNSMDGTFESRKTETSEGQGCWFEAGATHSFEGDWFGREKKVAPVMTFQKDGGSYALLKSNWSGNENFQLFRLDGEKVVEVESFAEAFKDPTPEPVPAPAPIPTPEPVKEKKGKKAKKSQKAPKTEQPAPETAPAPTENSPDAAQTEAEPKVEPTEDAGVNPLEGEQ